MKIKHLIMVGLLLAIITMGAASASEDIASDDLAASNDDSVIAEPDDGGNDDGDEEGNGAGDGTGDDDGSSVNFNIGTLDFDITDEDSFDDIFISVSADAEYNGTVTITCDDATEIYNNPAEFVWDNPEQTYAFDISFRDLNDGRTTLFNSKNFTIVFNNNIDIYASQTYLIIHDEDDNNLISFEEYDPDPVDPEEPEELVLPDFDVRVIDDFDVNNPDAVVLAINWLDSINGTLWVEIDVLSEDFELKYASRDIYETESETNFTVSDLGLEGADGGYAFWVYYYPEGGNPEDDDDKEEHMVAEDLHGEGRDYNSFWIKGNRGVNLFATQPLVSFYCAGASEGTVVLRLYRYDEEGNSEELIKISQKDIAQNDKNWLYWYMADLELEEGKEYRVVVESGVWLDEMRLDVNHPVNYNEVSYLDSDDEERIGILTIALPSDVGGSILITINGTEFHLETDEFLNKVEDDADLDDLYWEYYEFWGSIVDENVKVYYINNKNIVDLIDPSFEFSEGVYNVTVSLWIDLKDADSIRYDSQGNITVANLNFKEGNGTEIIIYDGNVYYLLDDVGLVQVTSENENCTVVITVESIDEPVYKGLVSALKTFDYLIAPKDLKHLKAGTYNMTVSCFDEDENLLLNSTASVTFDYGEDGIMWLEVEDQLEFDDDEAITVAFTTDAISGTVVVKFDGTRYYRKHITSEDLKEDEGEEGEKSDGWFLYIPLSELDPAIEVGEYELLEVFYQGDDGTEGYSARENVEVLQLLPQIYVPDELSLDDDDIIMVYPNGDESETIRIVLEMNGEIYFNATLDELQLILKTDEDGRGYYSITPDMLNKPLEIGNFYQDAKAYYISDKYIVSNEDEGKFPTVAVYGMLHVVECDYDGIVISVYCNSEYDCTNVTVYGRDKNSDDEGYTWNRTFPYVSGYFTNIYLSDLGLNDRDNVNIEVCCVNSIGDDSDPVLGGDILVVNSNNFWAKSDEVLLFERDAAAVSVFCPEGGEGKTVRLFGEGINDINYVVKKEDEGKFVSFSLDDLGISDAGYYDVQWLVNYKSGIIIWENTFLNVIPFAEVNENDVVVIDENGDDSGLTRVVTVCLPYSDNDGVITVFFDNEQVFNKFLSDIKDVEYERNYVRYNIHISDLEDGVDEGTYLMKVLYDDYSQDRSIIVAKRNVVTGGNVERQISIDMFPVNYYPDQEGVYFALIEATSGTALEYSITIDGNPDGIEYCKIDSGGDGESDYLYISLKPNFYGRGTFPVAVSITYFDEDDNGYYTITNTGTLTVFNPEINVMPSGDGFVYGLNNDTMIKIIPNGDNSNFRIVVILDGEVYLNATRDELNLEAKYDGTGLYYTIGPVNFQKPIAAGDYSITEVRYYSQHNFDRRNPEVGVVATFTEEAIDPNFNIIIDNVEVGKEIAVAVTSRAAFSGNVTVIVNGQEVLVEVIDGKGRNDTTGIKLPVGNGYMATLTFEATEKFIADYAETTFNVTLIDPGFSISILDVYDGSPFEVFVSCNIDDFAGDVTVTVEGNDIIVHLEDGYGSNSTNITLPVGSHEAVLDVPAFGNYSAAHAETTFSVMDRYDPDFEIIIKNVDVGSPIVVTVISYFKDDYFADDVHVMIDGHDILVSVYENEGTNSSTGVILPVGTYKANLTYPGSVAFKEAYAETTFKVNAIDPGFYIDIMSVEYGTPVTIVVKANEAFSGDVTVKIDLKDEFIVSVKDGYGENATALILPIGMHYATLNVPASSNFTKGFAEADFFISLIYPDLSIAPISDVVQGNAVTVKVSARNDFSAAFKVLINGNVVAVGNIVNGVGSAVIPAGKLSVGTVKITVTTDAYGNFSPDSQVAQFKVKTPAKIVAKDRSVMYTSGAKYSITVYGVGGALAKNVQVVIKINGKKVATVKTNSKGVATYKIVQKPGTYKITAQALGKTLTKKLTVKHVVKLPKVKVKRSAKKLIIKVTLNKVNGKYLKGKKVTLKFKGKKYVAKTNKKGVAKFTIKSKVLKKLKKGKKVTYQATYLKDTVKRTVKVRK